MNGKGGVKNPPYKTNLKWSTSGPRTSIGPYSMGAEEFRPRRGRLTTSLGFLGASSP